MPRQPGSTSARARVSPTAKLLAAGLVCCTLDGAVRKWVLPNSGQTVQAVTYFTKDVFWILAAVTASRHRPLSLQVIGLRLPFIIGAILIVIGILSQLFNAALVGGVLSFKAMIGMPLLALIIAPAIGKVRDLEFLGKVIGVLCVGSALLGVLQFSAPPSHFLNQQVDDYHHAIQEEARIRACGPFVFPGGMWGLSMIGTWAGCLFLFSGRKSIPLGLVILITALTCAAAALSRMGMFSSLIIFVGAVVLSRGGPFLVALFTVVVLVAWPMISVEVITEGESELATAVFRRHLRSDSVEERAQMYVDQAVHALEVSPGGTGLGRYQACEESKGSEGRVTNEIRYEMEYARIIGETGLVGLLGVLMIRMAFLGVTLQAAIRARALPGSLFPNLPTASLVALGLWFVGGMLVFDHVGCFYAWMVGVMTLASFEAETARARWSVRNAFRRAAL